MRIPNLSATMGLAAFFLAANVASALYAVARVTPSPLFWLLYTFGTAWVVTSWVLADRQRLGLSRPIDFGWFVFYAWPVALPYHLFKSRGLTKGLMTLASLLGIFAAVYFFGVLLFYVVVAFRRA